ncbi:MAG: glutamate--tRNA ligase family protein [Candidatus Pacearchaeota archaeon]|nr:glutamate--tRNA ligase family protein [Candidatus Pacearchaeota archaeon]
MKDLEKKTRAYALKNALAHEGKAMQSPVISSLFNEGLKRSEVGKYGKKISEIILSVNSLSIEQQQKEFEKLEKQVSERPAREGLEELPDVDKKKGVIMRFAPSPSGPMHIGHAATACISFLYFKKYRGKFYFRIEDTNPENIYPPAYKMLEDEAKWLFDDKAKIIIQSERMEIYYNYIEKLIKKKAVYVCKCSSEKFKEFVEAKKNCPCRKSDVKENIVRWKKMLDKNGFNSGDAVIRFKSNMKDKNPAMRDFPLARINVEKHPRQGNKYRVWPLMNLAVAVDDIELKMTHIIRGKDHRDNAERQKMIYKTLNKKFPWTAFLGRIHFKNMELSTTKFRKDIEEKKYSGWDDKRLPTIASLRKQGYHPDAFWKLSEQIGLSESDKVIDREEYFRLLDNYNLKD